ncbi:putative peptidase [compost metagenome]
MALQNPASRRRVLQEALREAGLDALLVTQPENVRYLSGFTGSQGRLVLSREACYLIVDVRYREQAESESDCRLVQVMGSGYEEATAEAVRLSGARRLGFESGSLTYWSHGRLEVLLDGIARLVPAGGETEALRVIKDAHELDGLRRAARITAEAMAETLQDVRPGMTERDVAGVFEGLMRRHGGGMLSFPTLVGSGERSALAHPEPTDRPIALGDLLLLDGGTTVEGYHADMTRTIVVGTPDARQREVLGAVREALEAAIALMRPGMPITAIVKAAQQVMDRHGLGSANPFGLGHGVGLALHEEPWLVSGEVGVLQAGMVLAVEPGAYLRGWGGVRLEELVRVGAEGPERLTAIEGRLLALFPAAESC